MYQKVATLDLSTALRTTINNDAKGFSIVAYELISYKFWRAVVNQVTKAKKTFMIRVDFNQYSESLKLISILTSVSFFY